MAKTLPIARFDEAVAQIMDIFHVGAHIVADAVLAKNAGQPVPKHAMCEEVAIEIRVRDIIVRLMDEHSCVIEKAHEHERIRHQARVQRRAQAAAQRFAAEEAAQKAANAQNAQFAEFLKFNAEKISKIHESLVSTAGNMARDLNGNQASPTAQADSRPQACESGSMEPVKSEQVYSREYAPTVSASRIQAAYRARTARREFKALQYKECQAEHVARLQASYRAKLARDEFEALGNKDASSASSASSRPPTEFEDAPSEASLPGDGASEASLCEEAHKEPEPNNEKAVAVEQHKQETPQRGYRATELREQMTPTAANSSPGRCRTQ
jgi:phosphopantetheinyl transferase (holo-ACP synthase)